MSAKNSTSLLAFSLLIGAVLACSNPLARYTKQYHCQIAGESEPRNAAEYVERARVHSFEKGEHECALGACAEGIRLAPKQALGYLCRATVYQTQKQYDQALSDYREALRLEPDNITAYLNRGDLYAAKGELEQATEDFNTAIKLAPNDGSFVSANVYSKRADFYKKQKDFDHALNDYNEAIKRYPSFAWFYSNRGDVYLEKGDYPRAVDDYREAMKRGDEKDKTYFKSSLAEAYRKSNHPELADRLMSMSEPPDLPPRVGEGSPPSSKPTPLRAPISGGVLNGKAISLPKPPYPPIARAAHASGTVVVQVTVDENGNVISASAISGHPLLQAAAVVAARAAKFSPTMLSGQPVKVTGILQYNFEP